MAMNRRDFIRYLAVTSAGLAALPEQIAAFEHYYEVNAAKGEGLVAVDEIFIGGTATRSLRAHVEIYHDDKIKLALPLNLFGGCVRWVALPDQKIVVPGREFLWFIRPHDDDARTVLPGERDILDKQFDGHIQYIDQNARRHTKRLTECQGCLA